MNILLIGKPGSGKGTITKYLLEDGFVQLSTGDLLRAEIAKDTVLGKEIDALLKEGKFATDDTIFEIVGDFLKLNSDKSIVFDGFPRNLVQAKSCFDRNILFDKVFLIDVKDETLEKRIVNRRIHLPSGRVYNIETMPPKVAGKDDITGEELTHRNDDQPEILKKRLEVYQKQTAPIIEYLNFKGIDLIHINGEAPIQEQVDSIKKEIGFKKDFKFKSK